MSLRQLRGLARNVLSAKALPEKGGTGAPVKLAPRPDRPVSLRPASAMASDSMDLAAGEPLEGIGNGLAIPDDGCALVPCFVLQLPLWYEMWWDNGVFPGQPACDYMFGPLPANLTEVSVLAPPSAAFSSSCLCIKLLMSWLIEQAWYGKAWAAFAAFMAIPIWYHYNYVDEFRQPMVSFGGSCSDH